MAKKSSARPASPPAAHVAALTRIADLVAKGGSPARVAREAEAIIAQWVNEAVLDPEVYREYLAECCDQLGAGVEAAQEQMDGMDTSDGASLRQGHQSLAALAAARDAMARAQGTF
jgi:hypothetical protein